MNEEILLNSCHMCPPTGQGAAKANRSGAQEGDKGLDLLLLLGAAFNPCSGINHLILVERYFSIL